MKGPFLFMAHMHENGKVYNCTWQECYPSTYMVQNYILLVKLNPVVHNILRMQLLSLLLKKKHYTSSNPESSKQWGVFTRVLNQGNQATSLRQQEEQKGEKEWTMNFNPLIEMQTLFH